MKPYQTEILKIIAGPNPINGFATYVGQPQSIGKDKDYKVTQIIEDTQSFIHFGVKRYKIYIKSNTSEEILWRVYENVPITILYDVNSANTIIS